MKEFYKNAIPSAISMFIASLYIIVDGIFIGRGMGDEGLAAVNIVIPLTLVFIGIATIFAVGGGALVSKYEGDNQISEGVYVFRQVFKLLTIVSVVLSIVCIIFSDSIVHLLGATEQLSKLSSTYLTYYAIFSIPNLLGIVLTSFARNDGRPQLAMIATIFGAIGNIALDYLFIFEFGWGIKGAAIGTGLGQVVTVLIVLPHFILKQGNLTFGNVKLDINVIKLFVTIGFPSFMTEVAFSIIIFVHNHVIVELAGESGVAAYSIIDYVNSTIYMTLVGVTFGIQPLVSYYFGAKRPKEMLIMYKLSIKFSFILTFIFSLSCYFFGEKIISIFTQNASTIHMSYIGLNIENLAFFFMAINLTATIYYQAIEMPKLSNYLCIFRSMIFFPITAILFGYFFGVTGVWISIIVSELLSFISINVISQIKTATHRSIRNLESNSVL